MAHRSPIPSPPATTDGADALLSYVEHASSLVGLRLSGEQAQAVATAFAGYKAAAALMMGIPLQEGCQPASVYRLDES